MYFVYFTNRANSGTLLWYAAWIISIEMFSCGFASPSELPRGFLSQVHATVVQAPFLARRMHFWDSIS